MMLQRASIYQPPKIRVTMTDSVCSIDMGDGYYNGLTVTFEDEQHLLGFMRALADARCEPGVWQDTGEPDPKAGL